MPTESQKREMRRLAEANYQRVKAQGSDLAGDYERTTPPPHGKPFNDIKAVWGIQTSGKSGFVIDESDLPY